MMANETFGKVDGKNKEAFGRWNSGKNASDLDEAKFKS